MTRLCAFIRVLDRVLGTACSERGRPARSMHAMGGLAAADRVFKSGALAIDVQTCSIRVVTSGGGQLNMQHTVEAGYDHMAEQYLATKNATDPTTLA